MPPRPRLLAFVVAVLAFGVVLGSAAGVSPAAVGALAPEPVEPAAGAVLERGSLPWFEVRAPDALAVDVLVASRPELAGGRLDADVAATSVEVVDGLAGWRLPAASLPAIRPGTYFWQAVSRGLDGGETAGPVRRLDVALPASWLRRDRIPAEHGRQGRGGFQVARSGLPEGVTRSRLWSVAATSARRWGLRATGWTDRRPVRGDRRSVVGFGATGPGVFGVTWVLTAERVERRVRCTPRCVEVGRRSLGRVLLDRDVVLNDRLRWEDGPEYPWLDEADLESVMLHELGHFAGNEGHAPACAATIMAVSAAMGDWWRTPRDRFRRGCTRVTAGAASAAGPSPVDVLARPERLRFVEDERVVQQVRTVRVAG